MKTILNGLLIALVVMLAGCAGSSLGDVRENNPLQSGTVHAETAPLAECVRQGIERDSWRFGQPVAHSTQHTDPPSTSVYAMYSRSTLFEIAFHPVAPSSTRVEYRRSYDGHGTQEQAWTIINNCASQLSAEAVPHTGTGRAIQVGGQ